MAPLHSHLVSVCIILVYTNTVIQVSSTYFNQQQSEKIGIQYSLNIKRAPSNAEPCWAESCKAPIHTTPFQIKNKVKAFYLQWHVTVLPAPHLAWEGPLFGTGTNIVKTLRVPLQRSFSATPYWFDKEQNNRTTKERARCHRDHTLPPSSARL